MATAIRADLAITAAKRSANEPVQKVIPFGVSKDKVKEMEVVVS